MEQAILLARIDATRERKIADWAASGVHSRRVAAAWARELMQQPRSPDSDQEAEKPAESTMKIARRLGVDNSTAARARRLLVGAGFLCQRPGRHYYYVACPIPERNGVTTFKFGTYNFEFGGIDGGDDSRLRGQLRMLAEAGADAWAFQECSGWGAPRTRTFGLVEHVLGMRGFLARSNRGPGGDVAVFINQSRIRFVEERHEEQPQPFWHGVAHIITEVSGFGPLRLASAHLAPASPKQRVIEAEALQLLAEKDTLGPLIIGGDWNAFPLHAPDPGVAWAHEGKRRRKTNTEAAEALAEFMKDVGDLVDVRTPTVGYRGDGVPYQCDRVYTTLPDTAVTWFHVIHEEGKPKSDHRPAVATFNLTS